MARMKPNTFEYSETTSGGEERVYNALRDHLDDTWLVCHSWRWLRHPLNSGLKVQGEGDFVVFHPSVGIIVIEVKGGSIEYRDDGKYYSNNQLIQNPEKQASDTKFDIISRLREKGLSKSCRVSHCVWFPDCAWGANYPPNLNHWVLLDEHALADPESFLRKVVIAIAPQVIRPELIEPIEKTIHSSFKLIKSLRYKIEDAIREEIRLTMEQSRAFEFLSDLNCVGVRGRAGTGKTLLAVRRAEMLASQKERVLFLCYNRGLADFIRERLAPHGVDVFTYHAYSEAYLRKYKPWRIGESIGDAATFYQHMAQELAEVIDDNADAYSSCIVDEAQDLKPDWFLALREAFFPNHKFYYFFDPLQIAYSRSLDLNESHFNFGAPIIPLHRNMRNTRQVSQVALNLSGASYDPKKHFSAIEGDWPDVVLCNGNVFELMRHRILTLLNVHGIGRDKITILSMVGDGNSVAGSNVEGILVTSFRKFKGLDNDVILICDMNYSHLEDEVYKRESYMAVTRSRHTTTIFLDDAPSLMRESFLKRRQLSSITSSNVEYRQTFRANFDEASLQVMEQDIGAFKNEVLANELWTVHSALHDMSNRELDRYRESFDNATPREVYLTCRHILEMSKNYVTSVFPSLNVRSAGKISDLRLDFLSDEDMLLAGVIGLGIRSEMLHRMYPGVFPIMTRKTLWGMYFLTGQAEFIVDENRNGMSRTSHQWNYEYDRFCFYSNFLMNIMETYLKKHQINMKAEYRYGYINMMLFDYAEKNRPEIDRLYKWQLTGL